MKVLAVYYDLPPEVIPYVKERHDSFVERFGDALMPMDYASTERIWVLATPWKCLLKLDIGWMEFSAKAGWWLDWASIPGILESLEKRDDRTGIIAATIHDMMFAVQFPFFDTANEIFHQVMRLTGTGIIRAWYKWFAVQSDAGWAAWEESSDPLKQGLESRWVCVSMALHPSHEFKLLVKESK